MQVTEELNINGVPLAIMEKPVDIFLEPGEVGAILEMIVRDKNGKVTEYRKMPSKSFVKQMVQLLFVRAAGLWRVYNYISITDTANAAQNVGVSTSGCYPFLCDAGVGITTNGIVVGTGAVAPTINDYALGTLIAHGVGAGQLQYSAMSFGAPANDASVSQFRLTRDFANGSGGAITVNECGIYVQANDSAGNIRYFCTIRDVTGGINVPNGQTLTLNYQMQATV